MCYTAAYLCLLCVKYLPKILTSPKPSFGGVAPLFSDLVSGSSYIFSMFPIPYVRFTRAYGYALGISVQYGALSLNYWRVCLCLSAFSWDVCIGLEYKSRL